MTAKSDLRDKVALALGAGLEDHERPVFAGRQLATTQAEAIADAVLAVLDVGEIRAEALRDLARVLQEALPESPSAAQTDRMKFAIGFLNASAEDPYERKEDQ